MVDFAAKMGASKAASTLLVLFIPNKDRMDQPIDQEYWVGEAFSVLGSLFGGATAFPQGRGVWRDDAQGGKLLIDEPVIINCYTSEQTLEQHAIALRNFLQQMGHEPAGSNRVGDRPRLSGDHLSTGGINSAGPTDTQETEIRDDGTEHQNDCRPAWRKVIAQVPDVGGGALIWLDWLVLSSNFARAWFPSRTTGGSTDGRKMGTAP